MKAGLPCYLLAMIGALFAAPLSYADTAATLRVVDGDTAIFAVQVWPKITISETVRIHGIDAPETRGSNCEKRDAAKATARLIELLEAEHIDVEPVTFDSFGRMVAHVRVNGVSVATILLREKLVTEWKGKAVEWECAE